MTEPNYITRDGAKKLQEQLADLLHRQRAKVVQEVADAAAQGDRSENAEYIYGKRKLREIDGRIRWLRKRLEAATVVEPRAVVTDTIFFGAFVEVEDEVGAITRYRIVGEDEVDVDHGCISWRSPLGRALLKRRAGETVVFRRPSAERGKVPTIARSAGEEAELTVVSVRY
jgi:transcription elongation factor GreB